MQDQNPFLQEDKSTSGVQAAPATSDTNPFMKDASQELPQDVQNAQHYENQPVDENYCETFAEQMTDGKNQGASATQAWQNQLNNGMAIADPSLQGAKAGDKIYFYDPRQGNGHVGLLVNPRIGSFISAEPNGVKTERLQEWLQKSGQSLLGYVPVH